MDDTTIRMMQLSGKGYACSQVMMQMALEYRGEENPSLVRAMAGTAYGCGSGAGTCGALTGGAAVLALYAAKGADAETESERFMPMLQELADWFAQTVGEQYGGITCAAVTGEDGAGAALQQCGGIVAQTFSKALAILMENGFDLAG